MTENLLAENNTAMKIVTIYSTFPILLLLLTCQGCLEEERETLLQIKSSINYLGGSAFSTWYGQDCCQWEGVECNKSTSRVNKILFQYRMRNQGNWYPNATLFAQLKDLQELDLSGNQIYGFISPKDLHKLKHLQKLDLKDNSIADGSHLCWGNMAALYFLDVSKNHLQGQIPNCICKSKSLATIILSHNQLHGSIDACFSNMTSLKHLFLFENEFNGIFPSLLFRNLTNIQSFVISHNQFDDKISLSIFANLSKLSYLDISYNSHLEVETESPSWHPSFDLKVLKLAGCSLNNNCGNKIPTFISMQYHLQVLDLSYNSLVGSIPSWMFYNVSSELWTGGNNFTGFYPRTHGNMPSKLVILDVPDNVLHGLLPADINLFFPELCHLNASYNMLSGNIPQSFGEMRHLQSLDLSHNNFHGEIPDGIKSNMTSLQFLKLSNNNLQGEALSQNSMLPNLRWLYLHQNGFSGLFPSSLSNCSSLQILSISYNSLSGELSTRFPVLPRLRALLLGGNNFEGKIPLQLCQMKHLHLLDLSRNDLSGDIPICLDNITSMTEEFLLSESFHSYSWITAEVFWKGRFLAFRGRIITNVRGIDFSSNKLTGSIPLQLTRLRLIRFLNMSSNLLKGQIPASLANLTDLESLDVSHNMLSGTLPEELQELTFLSLFNVSFNDLSGPILKEKQFSAFDDSSYLGNPGLCGIPLARKCNQEERNSSVSTSASTKIKWFKMLFFIAIVI